MSPKLMDIDVEAIAARLAAAGDAEAAAALRALRDAVAAQDEALRDFVCEAREVREERDEGGGYVEIKSRADGFDDLATAFGYPPVQGHDAEAMAEAAARHGQADPYDGMAYLSGLDHLQARVAMDLSPPEELLRLGYAAVRVGHGAGAHTLYHWDERRSPALAESRAAAPPPPAP